MFQKVKQMIPKISGVTSETNEEIQRRLLLAENIKARKLLETAMSHMQAFAIVKTRIVNEVTGGTKPKPGS